MFCCTFLYVNSSIAIILVGKKELVALPNLSSCCLVMVERLFLTVPWCPFKNIFDFTTAGDWDCVAAVERLPALHYSVDFISCPLGS